MGAEVVSKDHFLSWSLSQIAQEFGIARETVSRRLNDAGVQSAGVRRGHPVYRVAKAAEAILVPTGGQGGLINDPDMMTPKERADWYKSENDRLKFERENGQSIHALESREQMAIIAKTGLQVLETLPDILERDFNLPADVIVQVEETVDALRLQWAKKLEEVE